MKRFNPAAATTCGSSPPDALEVKPVDRRQEYATLQAQRESLFTKHYGQPGSPRVIVPYGMMAVHVSVKFDNSDIQTDYFDRHASLSPDFVLLVVKKQAESERLARQALALCPELAGFDWKWHTEKYSMGHGNYLESSGFELPYELKNLETGYRAGGVTHGHWEIEFSRPYRDGSALELLPHTNFGKATEPAAATRPLATGITLTENKAKQGLELRFPNVPSETVRAELKAAGWRWSRFGGCWYIKQAPERLAWAETFVARHHTPPTTSKPVEIIPSEAAMAIPQMPSTWRNRFKSCRPIHI